MRRFRLTVAPLAVVAVLGFSVGCSSPEPGVGPGDDPSADHRVEPRDESAAAGRLTISDKLAGTELVAETEGPWAMRRSGSASGSASGDKKSTRRLRMDSGAAEKMALAGPATGGGGAPARSAPAESASEGTPPPAPESPGDWGDADESASRTLDDAVGGLPDAEVAELMETESGAEPRARRAVDGKPRSSAGVTAKNLRAGATDDNADYAAYLEFLATWVEKKEIRELYYPMDVSDRKFVRVVDADGNPVPGAVVSIVDEMADEVRWTATTYGDGRVPFYPYLDALPVGAKWKGMEDTAGLIVEAYLPGEGGEGIGARVDWDYTSGDLEIALTESIGIPDPVQLDVCFVIDTTGSMGDEIASIKASLLRVTDKLRSLEREFDLRYSAVLYRDIGDDYVTATHAFTADIEAFDEALRGVQAAGGGDGPESLNQAMAQAVDGVAWRPDAAKVAFLIADAQPHMDYAGDIPYGESARAALAKGIRFHSVAASGLDPVGTLVFRQIAQFTRGKFIFIEYGTPASTAKSHGVGGAVKSDNLEDILFAQLRDEVATYGRAD